MNLILRHVFQIRFSGVVPVAHTNECLQQSTHARYVLG